MPVKPDTPWNPEQYLRFADHRLRPALELLNRIPLTSPGMVYDLGCGTGNVTRLLGDRWKTARVIGIDNSASMLELARSQPGDIQWIEGDVVDWTPEAAPHLIFSNAALHWVDGHRDLFPRLAGYVSPGGCLAVQMPLSWRLASHRLMRDVLDGRTGQTLGSPELRQALDRKPVLEGAEYHRLLAGAARSVDVWETEYLQVLEGEDPVFEWVRGTGLRPVLDGLSPSDGEIFLAEYRRRLRDAYPPGPDGRTLYPFRRLFIVAHM